MVSICQIQTQESKPIQLAHWDIPIQIQDSPDTHKTQSKVKRVIQRSLNFQRKVNHQVNHVITNGVIPMRDLTLTL